MHDIDFDKFKNGTTNIVTMSFDDGPENDRRLAELFNRYGIKSAFHLISDRKLLPAGVYEGHEVSCHTVHHRHMDLLNFAQNYKEWMDNRIALEKYCGYLVRGASYPYGNCHTDVVNSAKMAGIAYSRTTKATNGFGIPDDFMKWDPTCHFSNAENLADSFVERSKKEWTRQLFYIWGHSYELDTEEAWKSMEKLCQKIGGIDNVWYATNIEICDYITALKQLRIYADNSAVYNPTDTDLWITVDGKTVAVPHMTEVRL